MYKKTKSYLADAPAANLSNMASYIDDLARGAVLVIDNNVIPDPNEWQLQNLNSDSLQGLAKYNNTLVHLIRDFSSDRVIVTQDISKEIIDGIAAAMSAIRNVKGKTSDTVAISALAKSYDSLKEQLGIEKRILDYASCGVVYDSLIGIARKLVLDNPVLKKDIVKGENENDEKMIACAFSQAIKQDKKVCILSCDYDVRRIAAELYQAITARNIICTETITGQRIKKNRPDVIFFDPSKNLFQSALNLESELDDSWHPEYYSREELKEFAAFVQKQLLPAEVELGNGRALSAIIMQKESTDVRKEKVPKEKPAEESVEETAEEAAEKLAEADCTGSVEKKAGTPNETLAAALERIYQRLRIDAENMDNAEQSRIEEAIKDYEALISVYTDSKASTSKLEKELRQIKGKSFAYQLEKLTEETRKIQAEAGAIYTSPDYISSDTKQAKFEELNSQIKSNAEKIKQLQSGLKQAEGVNALASLDPAEKELYASFRAAGFEIKEEGVVVSSDQLAEITQRAKTGLYTLLGQIEREIGIERNSHVRPAQYRIELRHLPYLVKKR